MNEKTLGEMEDEIIAKMEKISKDLESIHQSNVETARNTHDAHRYALIAIAISVLAMVVRVLMIIY